MANRYFVDGGVDNDWSGTDNWASSSGGAGGETAPTSSDDVYLDGNSPDCDVDTAASTAVFDCTGYTNTLTLNANIQMGGSTTFVSGMTFTPNTNKVTIGGGDKTIDSGGQSFYDFEFNEGLNRTYTLSDDITCTNDFIRTGIGNLTFAGAKKIFIDDDFIYSAGSIVAGVTLEFNGTDAQVYNATSPSYESNGADIIINKGGGTLTFTSGTTANLSGSITHTQGTVVFTGTTIVLGGNAKTITSNGSLPFNDVVFGRTSGLSGGVIFADDMDINGDMSLRSGAGNYTFTGAFNIDLAGDLDTVAAKHIGGPATSITFDGSSA